MEPRSYLQSPWSQADTVIIWRLLLTQAVCHFSVKELEHHCRKLVFFVEPFIRLMSGVGFDSIHFNVFSSTGETCHHAQVNKRLALRARILQVKLFATTLCPWAMSACLVKESPVHIC